MHPVKRYFSVLFTITLSVTVMIITRYTNTFVKILFDGNTISYIRTNRRIEKST